MPRLPSRLAAALVATSLLAQGRAPVPDDPARSAVRGRFEDLIASVLLDRPERPVDRLLELARAADTPALRYELLAQAERTAFAAADVGAALRVADALAASFEVEAPHLRVLADFESAGTVAKQVLAAAFLSVAQRIPEDAAASALLERARSAARGDEPPGLREFVEVAAREVLQARRARARLPAGASAADVAMLRAFYDGEWQALLEGTSDDRVARLVGNKIRARGPEGSEADRARAGEAWLDFARSHPDSLAQRHLRRRAIELMLPLVRTAPADESQRLEIERVRRLVEQATANATEPVAGVVRFAAAADLQRLVITGGEWTVADGELRGRSLGPDVATRATTRFAWRTIDSVTIRGGIRSADGLNFRLAVGPVNVLLNWECADQNHAWFGEARQTSSPRALRGGHEHTIVVRQCGDDVVVAVDGTELICGPARLAGTVSVYPAIGSEIFVRSIDVVGDVDLGTVVTGPGVAR